MPPLAQHADGLFRYWSCMRVFPQSGVYMGVDNTTKLGSEGHGSSHALDTASWR